jgi:hypothetical protein
VRLKIIACEIFFREVSAIAARSPHTVDVEWLPMGLHDLGGGPMRARLQQAIDATASPPYDTVVLAYGLCNNGLIGLTSRVLPLVVPRAHDCITAFLGSRGRYAAYFDAHPGTYFRTSGWIERGGCEHGQFGLPTQVGGASLDYEKLVAQYGEDNARYLLEELGDLTRHYRRLAFIRMGVEPGDGLETQARREAAQRGWEYERLEGDLGLLERLINGPWDAEELLLVPPGGRVAASHDQRILRLEGEA